MNSQEIRDRINKGDITPDQASLLFLQMREKRQRQIRPITAERNRKTGVYEPKSSRLPVPGDRISRVQVADREGLALVRSDLAQAIQNRDAEHFYQRSYVEENVRHAVGLFAYGFIGAIDGLLDSAGYGLSEIVEDITFTIARTARKFREGLDRGWNG